MTSDSRQAKMFRFDITTNTVTVTANVTGTPYYTTLIETGKMPLGIAKHDLKTSIKIFPNPANDILTIDAPNNIRIDEITILDITGKVVKVQTGAPKTISITGLREGNYILKIRSDNKYMYGKFTK